MSRRLPAEEEPNPFARQLESKRRAGKPILDLTVTDPGAVGLEALDAGAVRALADAAAARYAPEPRGLLPAREAVAGTLSTPPSTSGGSPFDPERIFLTASTSEAYAHLFRLLGEPGDRVAIPRPSYPLLEPIAQLEDIGVDTYRLAYDGRWRLDLDSLEAAVGPRTRAIVVVEPNHPTGSVLSGEERAAVETLAARRGVAIIADEVFREFPWVAARTLPTWSEAAAAPTFVLGGISKSCGLPQLKLGWIALSGPAAAVDRYSRGLEWILDLFLSVATPVQVALPALLARRGAFQAAALARVRENLELWNGWAARRAAGGAEVLHGDGGWSAIVRLGDSSDAATWALDRHDVLLHPAYFYDLADDRHVVTSLLPEPSVVREALHRLDHGMEGASPG